MEWTVPVNEVLREEITKVNYTLIPPGFQGDVRSIRVMQDSLSKLIDVLGEQSASAQALNKIITTADKLRNSPAHTLYLLKDANANSGKGELIGMLKVGRKHLFLFDERDKVCEVEPLCVLDFYVVPDRQRHGLGKMLFDHMLKDMECSPLEMAIDGPSAKMESFLAKNYGVERLVRQNNNFAVAPQFFSNAVDVSKSGRSTPVVQPAVGRFAAHKPPSAIATVIHGGGNGYKGKNNDPAAASPPGSPVAEMAPPAAEVEAEAEAEEPPPLELATRPSPERPCTLQVEAAAAPAPLATPTAAGASAPMSPAGSTISRRDSQLTDRGFFDVKFYHNKLW
ncbi:alpha-tubulin N-acetyltransferase 1-like [Galleria mellonella]|uniref:Alpha-tubulin N-acetyltransferase n=1 Tax=Galleria mellonella TaxID=7137 RepID=A0ABM3MJ46_GALME|nr:alpha-tubulin N-acetyltransferase 1-like [Galleria mellonella]